MIAVIVLLVGIVAFMLFRTRKSSKHSKDSSSEIGESRNGEKSKSVSIPISPNSSEIHIEPSIEKFTNASPPIDPAYRKPSQAAIRMPPIKERKLGSASSITGEEEKKSSHQIEDRVVHPETVRTDSENGDSGNLHKPTDNEETSNIKEDLKEFEKEPSIHSVKEPSVHSERKPNVHSENEPSIHSENEPNVHSEMPIDVIALLPKDVIETTVL